jgi:hypothetical protein
MFATAVVELRFQLADAGVQPDDWLDMAILRAARNQWKNWKRN